MRRRKGLEPQLLARRPTEAIQKRLNSVGALPPPGRLVAASTPVISSAFPAPASAAVVAHLVEDGAERHVAALSVRLAYQLCLAATVARDPQEPGQEGV